MKNYLQKIAALFILTFCANHVGFAQGSIPCDGSLYFTRQVPRPVTNSTPNTTNISSVNVSSTGTVSVSDKVTLNPNALTNATVYYNGYVFTQQWDQSSFTLARISGYGATNNYETKTISSGITLGNYNNAGVDKNGIMYILSTAASPILYKIDLKNWSTTLTVTSATCTMTSGSGRIWGDIAFDPQTGRAYAWYHPSTTPTTGQAVRGLYEIKNYTTNSPSIEKVGSAAEYTMGTLFFNERGQLFSYGVTYNGGNHINFYSIDKTTGQVSSIGSSETSPQSDGCECAYRLSLTLTAGDGNGRVDIPNCSKPSDFNIKFGANNTASGAFSGITFSFPLDPRFSFADTKESIETYLKGLFGSSVAATLTSTGGGTNNVLNVTGMAIDGTTNNSGNPVNLPFELKVKVVAGGDEFDDEETVDFQAEFGGLSDFYGTTEPSSDPLSLWGKKASTITFNKTNDLCNMLSGNVLHDANGLLNDKVDGTNVTTNMGLKAVLVNEAGNIVAVTTVGTADGTYSFPVGPGTYSVILTTASVSSANVGSLGSSISATPPANWQNTGENLGTASGNDGAVNGILTGITIVSSDVTNANFGIQQPPTADSKTGVLATEPTLGLFVPIDGTVTNAPALSGKDPEDQPATGSLSGKVIYITALPTNSMELWYDNQKITLGKDGTTPPSSENPFVIENLDPSKLKLKLTGAGAKTTTFSYAYRDLAGAASPPATYTLSWDSPLPVTLVSFEARAENNLVTLQWKTTQETNASHFVVERASDAKKWQALKEVKATGESNELTGYTAYDDSPRAGMNYYRLKMVDLDGSSSYSRAVNVKVESRLSAAYVHPNPVSGVLRIKGVAFESVREVSLTNVLGQVVARYYAVNEAGIDLSRFANGVYFIKITTVDGSVSVKKLILSK